MRIPEKPKTDAYKNMVANRFQLNSKRNVGPTSESIRMAQPRSREEWESYYYENVRSREHIADLGRRMYAKIQEEVVPASKALRRTSVRSTCTTWLSGRRTTVTSRK